MFSVSLQVPPGPRLGADMDENPAAHPSPGRLVVHRRGGNLLSKYTLHGMAKQNSAGSYLSIVGLPDTAGWEHVKPTADACAAAGANLHIGSGGLPTAAGNCTISLVCPMVV